jgi:hypothetical protein
MTNTVITHRELMDGKLIKREGWLGTVMFATFDGLF